MGNMVVSIEFIGNHRVVTKTDSIQIPITEKTTANDVLVYLGKKYPGLSLAKESILITVNRAVVPRDRLLKANDTICLIPYVGGG